MRKLLMIIAIAMLGMPQMRGQETNGVAFDDQGCFSIVIETNATAKQIYNYSKSFFSSALKDFQKSLHIDEPDQSRLQISASFYLGDYPSTLAVGGKYVTAESCYENFKMTVNGKDGRYRIKIESPDFQFNYFGNKENQNYSMFKDFVQSTERLNAKRAVEYEKIITQLKEYIEKQIADEDF